MTKNEPPWYKKRNGVVQKRVLQIQRIQQKIQH